MKGKGLKALLGVAILGIGVVGYLIYDGMVLTDKEVVEHLEELHKTEVKIKSVDKTDRGKIYTLETKKDDSSFEFKAEVERNDKLKMVVKSSSYEIELSEYIAGYKFGQLESLLSSLGLSLYTGELENQENEAYSFGVTSTGEISTKISLLYNKPLTLDTLDGTSDVVYNAIKIVRGMEFQNPYIDLKGSNGESISGQVILADLDNFTSASDVEEFVARFVGKGEEE